MTALALPAIIDGLVSVWTTGLTTPIEAGTVRVVDGIDISDNPSDVCMVGVDNPANYNDPTVGSFTQVVGPMGSSRPRDETGTVTCAVIATLGEDEQKAVRDRATTYFAALSDALRSDPTAGISGYRRLTIEIGDSFRLIQGASEGRSAVLIFNVSYIARV